MTMLKVQSVSDLIAHADIIRKDGVVDDIALSDGSTLKDFPENALLAMFCEMEFLKERLADARIAVRAEFMRRMLASVPPRRSIYHPDLSITLDPPKGDPFIDEVALYDLVTQMVEAKLIDPELADMAIGREEQTGYKYRHHKTRIRQIVKMGGDIASAIAVAFKEYVPPTGALVLNIELKPKPSPKKVSLEK